MQQSHGLFAIAKLLVVYIYYLAMWLLAAEVSVNGSFLLLLTQFVLVLSK